MVSFAPVHVIHQCVEFPKNFIAPRSLFICLSTAETSQLSRDSNDTSFAPGRALHLPRASRSAPPFYPRTLFSLPPVDAASNPVPAPATDATAAVAAAATPPHVITRIHVNSPTINYT